MFEDQMIELLPARTTMSKKGNGGKKNGNKTVNVAVNVIGNVRAEDSNVAISQAAAAGDGAEASATSRAG